MHLKDTSGLSSLLLAILAPQVFGIPINQSNPSLTSLKLENLHNNTISFIPSTKNSHTSLLPKTTIIIPNGETSEEHYKDIIQDIKNNIPTSSIIKRTEINTQDDFNRQALKLLREATSNNQIHLPDIPYNNIVDLEPCINILQKEFPEISDNFSIREACDSAYKEIFPDYANRETISKDKNTQRLIKIIVPSILAPTMFGVLIGVCCCCCAGGAMSSKRVRNTVFN